ncbi:hypothetical protein LR48_Vigan04g008100 [Vigna angularis]|uniref:Uncharacterized protein n=2 Tax=Phaseolus angularis TaxID=3914 RepID=A0A0L9UAV8_PHAAN|nr:hypothetical protein LR48_Vigan04g008100 [Vigna angularis]BAT80104.1 hypothetical protein VIGAN_02307200 [Vigna angularis var. angularis]
MGLEILEGFRPITPIRTVVPTTRTFKHDLGTTKEMLNEDVVEECHTPTSPSQKLRTPLVCPPAPKKPRLPPRRHNSDPPSQGFFSVSHDLASIFVLRTPNLPTTTSTNQPLF